MKKILSLLLCVLLAVQCIPFSAEATGTDGSGQSQTRAVPDSEANLEYAQTTILSGCRTLDAQVPLGGDNRMLDTAIAAFVYERNTGTVIYSYNPDLKVQPGTFAKMVAAIVALENGKLSDEVTVSSRNYKYLPYGARNANLKEGEVLTLEDLLHCMFLEYANDAALTIAEHISGTEEAFVKKMNEWVRRAGCQNTNFSDCHGLGSDDMYTTARDLARIVEEAMKNSDFRDLFCAKAYIVAETNRSEERKLKASNYLFEETILPQFNYKGVQGGITHYSKTSGAGLVSTAENNGMSFTVVVLGCERVYNEQKSWLPVVYGNYEEAWDLLDYAFQNYKICRLLHEGQSMTQFSVAGGENDVVAQTHVSKDAILPINAKLDNLILKYTVEDGGLTAPIAKDQKIAQLQIWYRNSCIAEADLFSMSSVRALQSLDLDIQGAASRDDSDLGEFMSFVGIVCLVILVPLAVYLAVNNARRLMARNRRRRRMQQRRRSR